MNEAQERVKNDLVKVLNEYEDVSPQQSDRDNAVEFFLHGKRISYQYDYSNLNARSDLRRKLRELGALPKPVLSTATPPPPPMDQVQPTIPEPAPMAFAAESTRPRLHETGYTIFQSRRVIGIEIDRDLTITKGNVLVIPLHRPNAFVSMPSAQFHLLFDEHEETASDEPEVASPVLREPRPRVAKPPSPLPSTNENDLIAYLRQRNGAVKSQIIAKALGHSLRSVNASLRSLQDRGIVIAAQPGFWTLASKGSPTATRTTTTAATVSLTDTNRSRQGVSPQMGRILAAMAYVTKSSGRPDITTAQVVKYLNPRDAKQYGARLPIMVQKGFAQRGLPLTGGVRGWHYQITPKGIAVIRELRAWVYEHDNQKAPEWVDHL